MKTPRHILAQTIAQKTLNVVDTKVLAQEVAAYLISENREHELESLMRDIMNYRQSSGIVEADIVSAHKLNADITAQAVQLLRDKFPSAKQVIVRETQDLDVIGGLKIKTAHQQLDMSVRNKLDIFSRLTSKGNV